MKRQVPIMLAILASVIPVVAFLLPAEGLNRFNQGLDEWMVIIASFALVLGFVSLVQVNLHKVRRRSKGWIFGLITLASFGLMAAFGLLGGQGTRTLADGTTRLEPFTWLFQFVYSPLQSTMFSLLAFYVASASYRAFRVRNVEASLLLVGAVIIMVGRVPLGQRLLPGIESLHIPGIADIAEWIMKYPNAAAQRGVIIGAALGAASMSIRVMVGIERPYLGKS
jgi:hypothetical protein